MCECGCTANDERFTFPGPGKSFYLLTLSAGCDECDAPSGVIIERIKPGDFLYSKENREDFIDGELTFEKWNDSEAAPIVTGFRKHEFVKALTSHLVGTTVFDLCDEESGVFDEIAAETLLEEMYDDSMVKPHFPVVAIS